MSDIPLSKIASQGSFYRVVSTDRGIISSGASGDVLIITASAGQVARLKLLTTAVNISEDDMTLSVDSNIIHAGEQLAGELGLTSNTTTFCVKAGQSSASEAIYGVHQFLFGNNIVLSKDTGSTTQDIAYAVDFVEAF